MRWSAISAIAIALGLTVAPAGGAPPAAPLPVGPVVVRTIPMPGEPRVAAVSGTALWVLVDRSGQRRLVEIGPAGRRTGRDVLIATGVPRDFPFLVPSIARPSVAVTPGALWTVDPVAGSLVRVRTSDARVDRFPVGARYVAAGPAGLWVLPGDGVAAPGGGSGLVYPLARIEPESGLVAETRPVGPPYPAFGGRGGGLGPVELAVAGNRLRLSFPSPERFPRVLDLTTGALTAGDGFAWQLAARRTTIAATRRTTCDVHVAPETGPGRRIAMMGKAACRRSYVRDVALGPRGAVWALFDRGTAPGMLVGRTIGSAARGVAFLVGTDPVDVVASGRVVWVLDRTGRSVTRMELVPG